MSSAGCADGLHCTLLDLPATGMVEFIAFRASETAFGDAWPAPPGAARRGAEGWPMILHIAPARWLVPDPGPELSASMAGAAAAGAGTVVEVEGKWAALELRGADAARLLSASLDVAAVLAARDCAAVMLFDCPVVLVASAHGYRIYVKASYAADFKAAVLRLCAGSQEPV